MHEGQTRRSLSGEPQFFEAIIVFFAIQVGFAHEQVELRSIASDFNQPGKHTLFQFRLLRLPGRDRQHIDKIQIVRFLRFERLQRVGSRRIVLREEIAQSQQITRLRQSRRIVHHGFEGGNRILKSILPIIRESDIEPDPGNVG